MTLGSRSVVLQRRLKIADWIRKNGVMRVDVLCETLGVSAVTIRSDLAYLEVQGMIVRSSGKARPATVLASSAASIAGLTRSAVRPMVGLAVTLLDDEKTILIGPGTLTAQLITRLPARPDLSVVVTSLNALSMARENLDGPIYLLGGQLGADGASLDGPQAVHALAYHAIEVFFVQGQAITHDALLLAPGSSEPFYRAGLRQARQTIAILNSNGSSPVDNLPRLPLAGVDHVILPPAVHQDTTRMLSQAGFVKKISAEVAAFLYSRPNTDNKVSSR